EQKKHQTNCSPHLARSSPDPPLELPDPAAASFASSTIPCPSGAPPNAPAPSSSVRPPPAPLARRRTPPARGLPRPLRRAAAPASPVRCHPRLSGSHHHSSCRTPAVEVRIFYWIPLREHHAPFLGVRTTPDGALSRPSQRLVASRIRFRRSRCRSAWRHWTCSRCRTRGCRR
uniref:Uncharacterized protein n=1 Tax=Aegilops tauschii subsp. strangulata TaxID=200361 RepID=A0A453NXS5_AEGTS